MSVFLVTWDINRAKPNYSSARMAFIQHLQTFQYTKDPGLDSVWFISTANSADQIDAFLRQRIDNNDRLIVTKLVTGQHQGWLSREVWDWINARI